MIVMTSMLLHASRQHLWLAVAVCVLAATPHRHACAAGYSEEAVKAAYLFRFAGYVIWPQRAIPNGDFVIAVVDAPGIARQLTSLAQNHLINDRRVEVREAQSVRNAGTPDMLFVGSGHAESLRLWKPASGSNSALVVTDEDGGLAYGSTLNFLTITVACASRYRLAPPSRRASRSARSCSPSPCGWWACPGSRA